MSLALAKRAILLRPRERPGWLRGAVVTTALVLFVVAGTAPHLAILIAGAVAGSALLLAISAAPQLGVYALVAATTFESIRIAPAEGSVGTVTKAVGALVVAAWALALLRRRVRSLWVVVRWPLIGAVAFVGWSALTIGWARELAPALTKITTLLLVLVSAVVVATSVGTAHHLRHVAQTHVAFGALVASISIYSALTSGATRIEYESWGTAETVSRTAGFVKDPNEFASAQLFVFSVALALACTARTRSAQLIYGTAAAVCGGAIIATVSRGGVFALVVVLGLWIACSRLAVVWAGLAAVAAAGLYLAGAFDPILHRATAYGPDPRLLIWDVGIKLWQDHALFGLGIGGFPYAFFENQFRSSLAIRSSGRPNVAHDILLSIGTETGLVGLLLWLGLTVAVFSALHRAARWGTSPDVRVLARGYLFALVGFLIAALFLSAEADKWLWFTIGLSAGLARMVAPGSPREAG